VKGAWETRLAEQEVAKVEARTVDTEHDESRKVCIITAPLTNYNRKLLGERNNSNFILTARKPVIC
jgi:hypothetical protein